MVILVCSPGSSDEHDETEHDKTKVRLRTMIAPSQNAPANGMGEAGKGSLEFLPLSCTPVHEHRQRVQKYACLWQTSF